MTRTTEKHRDDARQAINLLFSDMAADERDQVEALEELRELCSENIEVLKEQIRNQEAEMEDEP